MRDERLDFFKGILIWSVVSGHCINAFCPDGNTLHLLLRTFDLPMFMCISGFLLKGSLERNDWKQVLMNKLTGLVMPAVVWALVSWLLGDRCFYYFLWAVFASTLFVCLCERFFSNRRLALGVLVLLAALKILKEKGGSFVCHFVGGETADIDAKRFEEEVNCRGLNGIAIYKGKKYGQDKDEEFECSDIFVFPTFYHNECFPLVLLEAMQHGLPCISTNEGGIPGIIEEGKTGFMVEKQNDVALADKLEVLLNDSAQRRMMGENGRDKFRKEFTLEVFEKRFVGILSQVSELLKKENE